MSDNASLPGAVPATSSAFASLARRDSVLIVSSITLLTMLAWIYLVHLHRQMSGPAKQLDMMTAMGMSVNRGWKLSDVLFTFIMWAAMMIGMMGPSAAPMILVFAGTGVRRSQTSVSAAGLFGLGYVGVWAAFSWFAALGQWGLHQAALISESMAVNNGRIGGAILIMAGIYQFTPWKNRCLDQCRSPLNFLLTHWREGRAGAFWLGASHGIYCLGCCWALMCVLFTLGIMNLLWVTALAVLVLVEKIAPKGAWAARLSGVALIAYGAALVF